MLTAKLPLPVSSFGGADHAQQVAASVCIKEDILCAFQTLQGRQVLTAECAPEIIQLQATVPKQAD